MPKVEVTDAKGLVQSSGTGVKLNAAWALGYQTLTAAGSDNTDGTAVVAADGPLVNVTTDNNAKGVVLPLLADVEDGHMFLIMNTAAGNTLEVFPGVGDKITPGADNGGVTVAASAGLLIFKADADQWLGLEPAVVAA